MKKFKIIGLITVLLTILVFIAEQVEGGKTNVVERNSYGEGIRMEEYELSVEDELENEPIKIEVKERQYTKQEVQQMFEELTEKLDGIVLGENDCFDRVEKDLQLVTKVSGYPVQINWELSRYDVMTPDGVIQEANVEENGCLVELRGVISYEGEQTVYVRSAMVYPLTRVGSDKLLYDIQEEIQEIQDETKEEESFTLPTEVSGRKLNWSKKAEKRWFYVPLLGMSFAAFLWYRDRENKKRKEQKREEELLREYPGMISKFAMLVGAGTTVKSAWEKIVQTYEKQKKQMGTCIVYEEMGKTLREMQSGVTEAEAYERFGKRCGTSVYMKFGTLLFQNLRKGSRGMVELLRMESIQAFENRKNTAKRLGEEAGTKLLLPMFGMLAVVFVMVMVPAFMSMQI